MAPQGIGVLKKIDSQVKVFSQAGYKTETINIYHLESKWKKGLKILCPWADICNVGKKKNIWMIQQSVIYFRFVLFDFYFLKLLKTLKKNGCSIIIEIPTYPFCKELNLIRKTQYLLHLFFSLLCKKYIDSIVTYSLHKKIMGIDTISICNGIDTDNFPLKRNLFHGDSINLLVVAMVAKWHGIDRLINGLKCYYQSYPSQKVLLHIVGDGPALSDLKKQVKSSGLEDKVIFYGIVKGNQLDEIFDRADVGIASLGCHRKNIYTASDLKSREYSIRGLPFIVSVKLPDYPADFQYIKYFSADESSIDINEIVDFYDKLQIDKNYSSQLRLWAKKHLAWEYKMQPVIEYIKHIHAI